MSSFGTNLGQGFAAGSAIGDSIAQHRFAKREKAAREQVQAELDSGKLDPNMQRARYTELVTSAADATHMNSRGLGDSVDAAQKTYDTQGLARDSAIDLTRSRTRGNVSMAAPEGDPSNFQMDAPEPISADEQKLNYLSRQTDTQGRWGNPAAADTSHTEMVQLGQKLADAAYARGWAYWQHGDKEPALGELNGGLSHDSRAGGITEVRESTDESYFSVMRGDEEVMRLRPEEMASYFNKLAQDPTALHEAAIKLGRDTAVTAAATAAEQEKALQAAQLEAIKNYQTANVSQAAAAGLAAASANAAKSGFTMIGSPSSDANGEFIDGTQDGQHVRIYTSTKDGAFGNMPPLAPGQTLTLDSDGNIIDPKKTNQQTSDYAWGMAQLLGQEHDARNRAKLVDVFGLNAAVIRKAALGGDPSQGDGSDPSQGDGSDPSQPSNAAPARAVDLSSPSAFNRANNTDYNSDDPATTAMPFVLNNESDGTNPAVRNRDSSAMGLGQVVDDTWMRMAPQVLDPIYIEGRSRDQILALRANPKLTKQVMLALLNENIQPLQALGVAPTPLNLYLAYWSGSPTKTKALLDAAPTTPVDLLLSPKVINGNHLNGMTVQDMFDKFVTNGARASVHTRQYSDSGSHTRGRPHTLPGVTSGMLATERDATAAKRGLPSEKDTALRLAGAADAAMRGDAAASSTVGRLAGVAHRAIDLATPIRFGKNRTVVPSMEDVRSGLAARRAQVSGYLGGLGEEASAGWNGTRGAPK